MTGPMVVYGVGATKAGTSWLHAYFDSHPQTGLQPFKEMHYWQFDGCLPRKIAIRNVEADIARASGNYVKAQEKGDAAWMARVARNASSYWALLRLHHDPSLDHYLHLLGVGHVAPRLVADFTPAYAMADEATLREMQQIGRETRFIYLMRDPVARLWSNIRMNAGKGEGAQTRALEQFEAWVAGRVPGLDRRSDYAGTLTRLKKAVPEEHLFIGFYEELFNQKTLDELCAFLGLDLHPGDFDRQVWASPPLDMPNDAQQAARARLAPHYEAVLDVVGRTPDNWDPSFAAAAR